MKKIIATQDCIKKLQNLFGVSRVSVYKALRFKTQGERPDKIRQAALNMGATLLKSEK